MTRDDERRRYEGDVVYEVWRSGGDVDAIDRDRLDDSRYDGLYPEEAAARELRAQRASVERQRAYWYGEEDNHDAG